MQQIEIDAPLGEAQSAQVHVEFGAGELYMDERTAEGYLASGTLEYPDEWSPPAQQHTPGREATLRLSQTTDRMAFRFGSFETPRWTIHLTPQIPLALVVKSGASKANLNLERLNITNLQVEVGANDTTVIFPSAATRTEASVKGGAANLRLVVPSDVAARVNIRAGLASVNVDSRFRRTGDVYVSEGYEQAARRLDLSVEVGVSRLEITSG
jgi:hypothetical protein